MEKDAVYVCTCDYACVCVSCFLSPLLFLVQPLESVSIIAQVYDTEREEGYVWKKVEQLVNNLGYTGKKVRKGQNKKKKKA